MADFTALKTAIQTYIKENGNEEITGEKLQEILLSVVTTLGDSAINDLVTALANEVAARQNADGTLQQKITNEATARGNADTALGGRIDDEATARANGDMALSNRLGSTITSENTAADQIGAEAEARAAADTALQDLIDGITENIENGYVYAGIATPSSTPTTGKVFYLALTAGTYTNFGNTIVSQGINILKYNGSAWSLDAFIGIDDELTPSSNKLPKSGNVLENIIKNGSAFDLSAYNAVDGVLATYADLSAALTALNLLPAVYKQPGMSFRFVSTSDNKYVQCRLMVDEFTTDITQWAISEEGVLVENPEYIYVKADDEYKILWAIKTDGSIYYGAGVPPQIVDYINEKLAELSLDEYEDIVAFLDDFLGSDQTLREYLDDIYGKYNENPEWIDAKTDSEGKILEGIKTDGTKVICGGATILGKVDIQGATYTLMQNPEWIKVLTDAQNRIIAGLRKDGSVYINKIEGVTDIIQGIRAILGVLENDYNSLDIRVEYLEEIVNESIDVIPPVWQDSVNNCIYNVQNNNLLSARNGDSFVFVTDSHFPENKGNSVKLASAVSKRTNNKIFVHGGDFITTNKTRDEFFSIMHDYTAQLKRYYGDYWRMLYGNHDNNMQDPSNPSNNITDDEYYAIAMKGFENNVVNPERNIYYYWDNVNQNIRYVCFNFGTRGFIDSQLLWFDTIVKSAPANAHVCIFIHGMWSSGQDVFLTHEQHLADMCDAINTRGVYTLDGTTYDYGSVTAKVCCILCGHLHALKQIYHGTSKIPVIALEADMYSGDVTIYSQKVHFVDLDFTNGKIYIFTLGYNINDSQSRDKKEYNIVI